MHLTSKILQWVIITIVVLLAAGLVFLKTPYGADYEFLIVRSGSMEPALPIGSLVLVRNEDRYQNGDIITFRMSPRDELPTTHRVIGDSLTAGEMSYTTKGDANPDADPEPVLNDDVMGKVVLPVPFLGYLLDFARQPLGFVLLVLLPAGLIVFEELSKLWRAWRERKRKTV